VKEIHDDLYLKQHEIEKLHTIDNLFGGIRGMIQGIKKGLYKENNYELNPMCFGQESMIVGYNLYSIFYDQSWLKLYEIPGMCYTLFTMFDNYCQIEEEFFDLWSFCHYHDCSPQTIFRNEASHIFVITGILNSVVAIYFEDMSHYPNSHDVYFDIYEDIGKNIGKFIRLSLNFDITE